MKKYLLLILFVVFFSPVFFSDPGVSDPLTLSSGDLELTFVPLTGQFSLAHRDPHMDLLVMDSVYGSVIRIIQDGRVLKFEDSVRELIVDQSGEGIVAEYRFPSLTARVSFEFIGSDTLGIILNMQNSTDRDVYFQVLFDTTLGEATGYHFGYLGTPAQREFGFTTGDANFSPLNNTIFSGARNGDGIHIQVIPGAERRSGIQMAAGNIRRLTESLGLFSINQNRNFNLLPFSVNDSAILSTATVPGQGNLTMAFQIDYSSETQPISTLFVPRSIGVTDQAVAFRNRTELSEPLPSPGVTVGPTSVAGKERLELVNSLISRIDRALLNPDITPDQIQALRGELEKLTSELGF